MKANPYEMLANAIIVQAAVDYRRARRELKRDEDNDDALDTICEVEWFFRTEWFRMLTNVDPDLILNRLREECV